MSQFDIQINSDLSQLPIERCLLQAAIERVLRDAGITTAEISLAIVDDQQIHQLNLAHLQHDYATDVLSFLFESGPTFVSGEVIVSAETAERVAAELNIAPRDELLLYVVHGTLHLVGFDDQQPAARATMMQRELEVLAALGIAVADRKVTALAAEDDAESRDESRS